MDKTIEIYCCRAQSIIKRWSRIILSGVCLLLICWGRAQSGFAPVHGTAGNSSYTIGQVFYLQTAQGLAISEGVEQGYIIITHLQDETCEGTAYTGYGIEFGDTLIAGEYLVEKSPQHSILHYDSIVRFLLVVHPIWRISDTLLVYDDTPEATWAGTHTDSLVSQFGCDSIVSRTVYVITCPDDYIDTAAYGEESVPLSLMPPNIYPPHPNLQVSSDMPSSVLVGRSHQITWQVTTGGDTLRCMQNAIVHFPPCGGDYTIMDHENNLYHTIRVGAICWLKENLRSTLYPNGDTIPNAKIYTIGADTISEWENYGLLYSWCSAVNIPEGSDSLPTTDSEGRVQGACPTGWHIPFSEEMAQLGFEDAQSLRIEGEYWLGAADNLSGFSAMPAGDYDNRTGYFENLRTVARFWTSERVSENTGIVGTLPNICNDFYLERFPTRNGCSIRCIKN